MLLIFCSTRSEALPLCTGKFPNPITDICWSCLFPITIGSTPIVRSPQEKDRTWGNADTENPKSPFCACSSLGINIGFWEPIGLVDASLHRDCFVNLGGMEIPLSHGLHADGKVGASDPTDNHAFLWAHYYRYLPLTFLPFLNFATCKDTGDLDIGWLTELDPSWNDEGLSAILAPDEWLRSWITATSVSPSLSALSCAFNPDLSYWCMGNHGSTFPLHGEVQENVSLTRSSALIAERLVFKIHHYALIQDSGLSADRLQATCHPQHSPYLIKSRYRFQMLYPISDHSPRLNHSCHTFGGGILDLEQGIHDWDSAHHSAYGPGNFGYLIWRKRNCCLSLI